MAVDLALVIRAGSGAMWMLIGAFALVVGRRDARGAAIGALALAYGGQFLAINLSAGTGIGGFVWAGLICYAGIPAAAGVIGWHASRGDRAAQATFVVGWMAAAFLAWYQQPYAGSAVAYLQTIGLPADAARTFARVGLVFSTFGEGVTLALVAVLGVASRRLAAGDPRRRATALLAAAISLHALYNSGNTAMTLPGMAPIRLATLAVAVAAACAWLVATAGPEPRVARNLALSLTGVGLAGLAAGAMAVEGGGVTNATVGILRCVAAALLAYAIFRHDLLGVSLPRVALNKGALAASALAALFIVAQLAQEFLSAQYGLLMGGIVAGALLFAAAPIQRAAERLAAVPVAGATAGARSERQDPRAAAAFRAAVRAALRDGGITRREELHLMDVAEHVGLTPRQAAALRHEVEDEATGGGT